ncbi:hypothetical protein AYX07_06375 [Thermoactinomyces sp. AS95]|nr:hypothetical protein AYX07_06375 [Thermoactinomyces sp. AS95]
MNKLRSLNRSYLISLSPSSRNALIKQQTGHHRSGFTSKPTRGEKVFDLQNESWWEVETLYEG